MMSDRQRMRRQTGPVEAARARSSGVPLEAPLRAAVEPRFGHDFGQVRVHADAEADRLARGYRATAFAYGPDLYFREGAYAPASPDGAALLLHELAHVVQGAAPVPGHDDGQDGAVEARADAAVDAVVAGAPPAAGSAGPGVLAKDEELKQTADRTGSWLDMFDTGVEIFEMVPGGSDMLDAVPGLGGGIKAGNYAMDFLKGMGDDQGVGETIAELGGKGVAEWIAPYMGLGLNSGEGLLDMAVNTVNSGAKALGAGESVTDWTGLASDATASKMTENLLMQGFRGAYNLIADDQQAQARQGGEVLTGDAGSPLQGFAQAFAMYELMETGSDPVEAFEQVGALSEGTSVSRIYNSLEDNLGNGGTRIEDGVYKPTSGFAALDWAIEEGMDLDSWL